MLRYDFSSESLSIQNLKDKRQPLCHSVIGRSVNVAVLTFANEH